MLRRVSSLNVFHREPHPSSFKAGGYKEGLSVYAIINHTKVSKQGVRRWRDRFWCIDLDSFPSP